MNLSETAFVVPGRRASSGCGGSRRRSRSPSAGTRRSRARTCCGSGWLPLDGPRAVPDRERAPRLPRRGRRARSRWTSRRRSGARRRRTRRALGAALGIDIARAAPAGIGKLARRLTDAAAVRRSTPDFDGDRRARRGRRRSSPRRGRTRLRLDFVSRCFAPRVGIDEDPVTGAAHCALAPFWADRLGRDRARRLPGLAARRHRPLPARRRRPRHPRRPHRRSTVHPDHAASSSPDDRARTCRDTPRRRVDGPPRRELRPDRQTRLSRVRRRRRTRQLRQRLREAGGRGASRRCRRP